jgi:hypothetical protein
VGRVYRPYREQFEEVTLLQTAVVVIVDVGIARGALIS